MKMKSFVSGILAVVMFAALAGCGSAAPAVPSADGIDVDLTQLSSTMVYSEVYNMVNTPEDYLGKTVKMDGSFALYQSPEGDKNYYACLIADAAACCAQGIEFVWDGEHSYPEDYPELGSDIVVQGVFDTYEEDGYTYCQLIDADVAFE